MASLPLPRTPFEAWPLDTDFPYLDGPLGGNGIWSPSPPNAQIRVLAGEGLVPFTPLASCENIGSMGIEGAPMLGGPWAMQFRFTQLGVTHLKAQTAIQYWMTADESSHAAFYVQVLNSGVFYQVQVEIGTYGMSFAIPGFVAGDDVYTLTYDGDLFIITNNAGEVARGNTGPQAMDPLDHVYFDLEDRTDQQLFRVTGMYAGAGPAPS